MKIFWIALGGILVLVGIVGLILPLVPGIPFLFWGIAILAGYFVCARWLRMKVKKLFGGVLSKIKGQG
ncbi:MAG: hypothetical protein HYS44_01580 [Candidatus Niyogibacteria bacterium]|nr:hypothetical protein [Candidatus Niyogibacteria bacterium]